MDISQYSGYLSDLHDTSVLRFVKVKQDSGYVGNTYAWQSIGALLCGCYPVSDKMSIELYGPQVDKMMRLHFDPSTVIYDGDGIAFDTAAETPEYKVVSVKHRKLCTVATIEVIGVGN